MGVINGQFDMLGIASPLLAKGKASMRDLFIKESNLDWDTHLPDKMRKIWITFIEELVHRCVKNDVSSLRGK